MGKGELWGYLKIRESKNDSAAIAYQATVYWAIVHSAFVYLLS